MAPSDREFLRRLEELKRIALRARKTDTSFAAMTYHQPGG